MNTEETKKLYDQYLMATYKPTVVISKAKGSRVYDASGKQYYDMTSGIGVHFGRDTTLHQFRLSAYSHFVLGKSTVLCIAAL